MLELPDVFQAEKRISAFTEWVTDENNRLHLVLPLEDVYGVTIEGLLLRGRCLKDRADKDVMLQLEYRHDRKRRDNAIERIDWNPSNTHNNRGVGPKEYRFMQLTGSHRHSFHLNWLQDQRRLRHSNLPIAVPISQPLPGFTELLEFVGKCFRISNLVDVQTPSWEETFL